MYTHKNYSVPQTDIEQVSKMNPDTTPSINPDSLSRKSSESSTSASDDYVVVGANKSLTLPTAPVLAYIVSENDLQDAISVSTGNIINSPSTPNVVGKSIFYDCDENLSFQKSDTDEGMNYFITNRFQKF